MAVASNTERAVAERLRSIGISESYASQLARNIRKPSQPLAIRIFRQTGLKLGPIARATDEDIEALERLVGRAA